MTTRLPTPDPDPEDIGQGIAALEAHLAAHAPTEPPAPNGSDEFDGETRRVRRLRAQVAEARMLADLHDDDTPLLLDSRKVRRRRRAAHEAARLHALAQDPAMRAWQAARMRRVLVTAAMVSLTLALAWSTAGVQKFAADGAPAWSPSWLFAWLVEPFMSLALLVVVGAKAYMGTRGQPIHSPTLTRIEWLFLALTLAMNGWPYAPGIAAEFSLSRLVLHLLGPVVAVAVVTALPIILEAFAGLDHGTVTGASTGAPTAPTYRHNAPTGDPAGSPAVRADVGELTRRARDLIAAGALPVNPSATALRAALRCGTDTARQVRDELRNSTQ
ncbi:conjugal transfer protein TraI [Actinomadura craniellae]|uniref:Conjugal transfer protein TraI n=1 Tax=Actinomadura craniellae TaxID=2231787 RepID=A0A365HBB7_9ACTN|nr:conjugal transfer protein TraI [Actinomadura craniellae]RAY16375.1 conjugal transfer protein TraI [Actinomadura craniellae]